MHSLKVNRSARSDRTSGSMAGQGLKAAIEANSFRVLLRNPVLRPEAATRSLILRAKKDETGSGGHQHLVLLDDSVSWQMSVYEF